MDLDLLSLNTLVPEELFCVAYVLRCQGHWMSSTTDMVFASILIDIHTQTQTKHNTEE